MEPSKRNTPHNLSALVGIRKSKTRDSACQKRGTNRAEKTPEMKEAERERNEKSGKREEWVVNSACHPLVSHREEKRGKPWEITLKPDRRGLQLATVLCRARIRRVTSQFPPPLAFSFFSNTLKPPLSHTHDQAPHTNAHEHSRTSRK